MFVPVAVSLYCEMIMQSLGGYPGIKVGGYTVNSLRYADDIVFIAEKKEDFQHLFGIVEEERNVWN